ncbi:MAG TPA: hypothetical protein VKP65_16950 [Rhodothermales bacterium]|nr:hypothetical protein [Rhodothermales bacterium]
MITKLKATVYRGGNRRFFSLDAAAHAAARAKIKERCECDTVDHGAMGIESITCWYHEPENYDVLTRRLARIYKKAYFKAKAAEVG